MTLIIYFFILTVFLVAVIVLFSWTHQKRIDDIHRIHGENLLTLASHAIVSQHAVSAFDAASAAAVRPDNDETLQAEQDALDREVEEWQSKDDVVGFKAKDGDTEVEVDFMIRPSDAMLSGADAAALLFNKPSEET